MAERVMFITHKDKQILYIDFSYLVPNNFIEVIERTKKTVAAAPKHSLLTLTNVKKARFNTKVIEALKQLTAQDKIHVKKGAIIGLDGLQKIAYNAIMKFSKRNLPAFGDAEKAKDWLVK